MLRRAHCCCLGLRAWHGWCGQRQQCRSVALKPVANMLIKVAVCIFVCMYIYRYVCRFVKINLNKNSTIIRENLYKSKCVAWPKWLKRLNSMRVKCNWRAYKPRNTQHKLVKMLMDYKQSNKSSGAEEAKCQNVKKKETNMYLYAIRRFRMHTLSHMTVFACVRPGVKSHRRRMHAFVVIYEYTT